MEVQSTVEGWSRFGVRVCTRRDGRGEKVSKKGPIKGILSVLLRGGSSVEVMCAREANGYEDWDVTYEKYGS